MRLILASNSPRRREILQTFGFDLNVIVSDYQEKGRANSPRKTAELYAKNKAQRVFDELSLSDQQNAVVLGADTIVVLDNMILGKPQSVHDAYDMLWALSGRAHYVYTACAIVTSKKTYIKTAKTKVVFNKLSDEIINNYIASGSPMDKAGAYGIQDQEFNLVKKYRGSYYNVMGLPIEKISPILTRLIKK
ncbi:MAG: septum formation protein Maf [Clostridia bacterium]|nr:septum formation protein Maf [Clostridia bacterium]